MNYLFAFLCTGIVCGIAQIILDNTKLSAGHITSLFTVIGSFLAFFDIYPKLIEICGAGASILISNFGNMLYQGGVEGYNSAGFIGIFSGLLEKSSAAIVSAIVFAFLLAIFFKPKS